MKSLLANDNDVKATNPYGDTALMTAAGFEGSAKMVELLLPYSDVKATNQKGYTALMYAAESGNEKSVELLLPNSDVKATSKYGRIGVTALMYAALSGNEKSVELLLPNSDVKATDNGGNTALSIAAGFQGKVCFDSYQTQIRQLKMQVNLQSLQDMLLMKFLQLCYQFKDLLAISVAESEFDKNQNKPCFRVMLMCH